MHIPYMRRKLSATFREVSATGTDADKNSHEFPIFNPSFLPFAFSEVQIERRLFRGKLVSRPILE